MRIEDGKVLNLNPKRVEDIVDGPAVNVNKVIFLAVNGGTAVRLVFAEQVLQTSHISFRTAVVMTAQDAIEFSEKLKEFIDNCATTVVELPPVIPSKEVGKGS